MILKGQKRKFPSEDVEDLDGHSPTWESQRQFVFSVSLCKYQRSQELPEPSLRRSVLITNTLRQISLEASRPPSVDREVSQSPSYAKEWESISTAAKHCPAFDDSHSALSNCPVSPNYLPDYSTSKTPPSCHSSESDVVMTVDEDWGSMSTDSDFSLSAAISSILTALDSTIDGSPQASPRTPLRSLENLSGPSQVNAAWVKPRGYGGWEQQEQCRVRDSSTEGMRSSYLGELAVEDLFQDIDAFLLETDMGMPGLRSSSSSGSGYPASTSFSSQNHVREAFEMDHPMEILVES
ncbi:SERTA domain-containing protein 3 isoform X2 [Parambassis ranga]|uniref:SERTA domain-containing protein 3 isoform X2 n=1 Tax=Parambassis ranga TaxID=210632 RepID=A0A6P7JHU8_9TELE|nr:SERTA domain-containing protein 2-like isoform X2 [Parambassis ranga]